MLLLCAAVALVHALVEADLVVLLAAIAVGWTAIHTLKSEGIAIDFARGRYQAYQQYVGLRFGKWVPLPPVTNVVLFTVKQKVKTSRGWTTTAYTVTTYRLTLYNPATDVALVVNDTLSKTEAFEKAERLARRLNMQLEVEIEA
jgi:hypothetical protein